MIECCDAGFRIILLNDGDHHIGQGDEEDGYGSPAVLRHSGRNSTDPMGRRDAAAAAAAEAAVQRLGYFDVEMKVAQKERLDASRQRPSLVSKYDVMVRHALRFQSHNLPGHNLDAGEKPNAHDHSMRWVRSPEAGIALCYFGKGLSTELDEIERESKKPHPKLREKTGGGELHTRRRLHKALRLFARNAGNQCTTLNADDFPRRVICRDWSIDNDKFQSQGLRDAGLQRFGDMLVAEILCHLDLAFPAATETMLAADANSGMSCGGTRDLEKLRHSVCVQRHLVSSAPFSAATHSMLSKNADTDHHISILEGVASSVQSNIGLGCPVVVTGSLGSGKVSVSLVFELVPQFVNILLLLCFERCFCT